MNERTRYRRTGLIFFAALAVIFLPMLFDGAGVALQETPPMPQASVSPQILVPDFTEVIPKSSIVEDVSALREEVDEQGFNAETNSLFGEPVLSPVAETTKIFAVQVASFAEQNNALATRKQLRDEGYEAFISTIKKQSRPFYRVAIGPLLARADALSIQSKVGRLLELEPAIVAMTP